LSILISSGFRSVAAPVAVGRPLSGQHCSHGAAGSSVARGVGLARVAGEVDGENSIVVGPPQAAAMTVVARRRASEWR
jgi:hypothetical protein